MSSASLRVQKAEKEKELKETVEKRERLIEARNDIDAQKNIIVEQKRIVKEKAECDGIWLGMRYLDYNNYSKCTTCESYKQYLTQIDTSIGDLIHKVARLQDQMILLAADIVRLEVAIAIAEAAEAAAALFSPGR